MHGLPREPVEPREDPALGLCLEVHDPAHRAIVLALGPVEMNAGHFPLGKVHLTDEGDPPRLGAIHPNGQADHEAICVFVEDLLRGGGPPEAGLAQPPLGELLLVEVGGCPPAHALATDAEGLRRLAAEDVLGWRLGLSPGVQFNFDNIWLERGIKITLIF